MSWTALNVHSQYSILDSTASVIALAEKAKSYKMTSLALTDSGNLYGAIDFYKACKALSIQPILGCEIWLSPGSCRDKKRTPGTPNGFPIVLLSKNRVGFRNLCKLSSIGFLEGFYYQPRIDLELLAQYKEGLICLSGPVSGKLGHLILHGSEEALIKEIEWFQKEFGDDYYFELQRHSMTSEQIQKDGMEKESWLVQNLREYVSAQEKVNAKLVQLSKQFGIKCVATNDIHYIEQSDFRAHEILLNIQSGEPCLISEKDSRGNVKNKVPNPKRDTYPSHEFYFKSPEQMQDLFKDLPGAIEETMHIAAKCSCELDFQTKHYPVFTPPSLEGSPYTMEQREKAAIQFLYELCQTGIKKRYTPDLLAAVAKVYPGKDPLQVVKDRFADEFEILTSKGMSDYMLIVYDFIAWAKKHNIAMGPGRGSAAGSIISYLIGITDIEPLRFSLFFERFINPERVSYPDIDVDICMDRRQEVIDYVVAKYGKEKVAQIITFGTMKAKMAIKDVGRVLGVALSKVNEIAALVPEDPTITLEKVFQIDPELTRLMQTDEEARSVLEMAKKAEGSIRNTSTHAAGIIICASPITDHVPVCTAKDSSMVVTQFAMKPVESLGMLKIDFLGLKTLTSVQKCVEMIAHNTGHTIDAANLPLGDRATFDLLNQGKTLGVFQLESGGMQDLAKQLHIDSFEEVIAVGALYRPGPMDMIPSFCNRKHGREEIEIEHPLMKDILSETYGVMVYQEQVMQIASVMAGYSLGEGDVLRRAMGKKDKEEMERQRKKFLQGCEAKGIAQSTAEKVFEKIEKFASYGFNKSHAAAYGYLSYVTAYFKANYPKEWMASLMTCDRDDTAKLSKFIQEARAMHIAINPPDINLTGSEFGAAADGIRFGMSGIKGIGYTVVEDILAERSRGGAFHSFYDFVQRAGKGKTPKKAIELLVEAGSFDATGWSRDAMRESLDAMYSASQRDQKESALGVLNLFSLIGEDEKPFTSPPVVSRPSTKAYLLQREKELLGFYLTGHPMDEHKEVLKHLSCVPLSQFETLSDGSIVRAAFVVEAVQIKISNKTQRKFAILTISDGIERFELPIWSDFYEEKFAMLRENNLLYAILTLEKKQGAMQLSCKYLDELATVDASKIRACDEAYDRCKGKVGSDMKWKEKKENQVQKEVKAGSFTIQVDADRFPLSKVMALKDLFRSHPGSSPIEIHFHSSAKKIGSVHIDASWGIKVDATFQERLQTLLKISE